MENKPAQPEVWLRGPLPGVPALLQPVAHALLQAREEVEAVMTGFPEELLWTRPAGVASVGFHLQHLAGVIDRLLTYAEGASLDQLGALAAEGVNTNVRIPELLSAFSHRVDNAIERLRTIDLNTLTEPRSVGRAKLPSTVLGLLFHAAEHTQRHVGQLLVTARVQKQNVSG
jgi:uncharacterized damage-inducible protein DinB